MNAVNPRLAAAIAAKGVPLSADLVAKPHPLNHAQPAETIPALLATIKEAKNLNAPLIAALSVVFDSMEKARPDEWAMEWLGDVWSTLPLRVRAVAGDEDAAAELAAEEAAS